MNAQPRRDAIAIADRMAPIVAAEGFEREWAATGPTLAQIHIDNRYAAIEEHLRSECAAAMAGGSFTTLHCCLATGHVAFIRAPHQNENRIVLDASSGGLDAYRGVCRLFGDAEQMTIVNASEILIVAKPDMPKWLIGNRPHPKSPCDLRIVIILPSEDNDYFDDLHEAAHTVVSLARRSFNRATTMRLVSGMLTEMSDGAQGPRAARECRPRTASAASRLRITIGKKARPSKTTDMLLNLSNRIEIARSRRVAREACCGIETTIFSSGASAAYWLGTLRDRTIEISGFQRRHLPAAFARMAMLVFSDSGGFSIESRELPAMIGDHSILVWGDDMKKPPAKLN